MPKYTLNRENVYGRIVVRGHGRVEFGEVIEDAENPDPNFFDEVPGAKPEAPPKTRPSLSAPVAADNETEESE